MSIEEHVRAVRARIDAAARAAGRDPGEITLCAATKVQTSDAIRQVIAAGVPLDTPGSTNLLKVATVGERM